MTELGAFTFVLHTHLPYARLAGRWPHGEEWLHEAATESYLPLLITLYDLRARKIPFKLTMSFTPVLLEQLTDVTVLEHLEAYLNARVQAAETDTAYYATQHSEDAGHMHYLAQWYRTWYDRSRQAFLQQFQRDIVGAFRRLQDEGFLEIITSAATHAYLPLLSRDESIHAQLKAAVAVHERHFGRRPRAIWLPECAYRPAYLLDDGRVRPGLETFLAQEKLTLFFSETHTITGGQPMGVAGSDAIGPYGMVNRRYVVPVVPTLPERATSTYFPYEVSESQAGLQTPRGSSVRVIGRNTETGQQVWSSQIGYPGDLDYREFYKKSGTSGINYWRVTGKAVDLGFKDHYHLDWAAQKVEQHAEHFAHLVGDLLRDVKQRTDRYGILVASYNMELFGHWWFEGVDWLGKVLEHLAVSSDIQMTSPLDYLDQHPPQTTLHLPESSWGAGGAHFNWDNSETHWMWPLIHEREARMVTLAQNFLKPTDDERLVLNQAAREAMLMQSSDWQFLVTTGQAREYAIQRFSQHVERFDKLANSLDAGTPDTAYAKELYNLDNIFPDIDYQWYTPGEG